MINESKKTKMDRVVKDLLQDSSTDPLEMIKQFAGRVYQVCLENEMDEHLGYVHNSFEPKDTLNRRNGSTLKTLQTELGELEIRTPRDRFGSFNPLIVPKRQRRVSNISEAITLLYGQNMNMQAITKFVNKAYGIKLSKTTISNIISEIDDEMTAWRHRQLDEVYPIIFVDALFVKVKESYPDAPKNSNGSIVNKAVYSIIGLTMEGRKESLGLWIHDKEQASTWNHIFRDIRKRGVEDVMIVCSDGLTGLKNAIHNNFPFANQQRCIVHLVRNSLKYAASKHYKAICRDLRKIYQADTEEQALHNLSLFEENWGDSQPRIAKIWHDNWNEIAPMFEYVKPLRKIIYTNNSAESYHKELRKILKTKGALPNVESLERLAYLRTKDLMENRWRSTYPNWRIARNELITCFNRLEKYELV